MNKELQNKTKQNKEDLLNVSDSQLSNKDLKEVTGGRPENINTGISRWF